MNSLNVTVHAVNVVANDVVLFDLRADNCADLPKFTAGSHIEVCMHERLSRCYSLANDPRESGRYEIAVHKTPTSRGGSLYMHESVKAGVRLKIRKPKNTFPLNENAVHTVLIGGGIGITPLRAMIARLKSLRRSWSLYYCGRDRSSMAFLHEFEAMAAEGDHVLLHIDWEAQEKYLDLAKCVASAPPGTHFYCCGPSAMLSAFERATSSLDASQVHVEYFTSKEAVDSTGGFEVRLARSGRILQVKPGNTILEAVLEAGIQADFSCTEGICGACETRVIEGTPEHRDSVLSEGERLANDRMMICCSGCKGASLTLDL